MTFNENVRIDTSKVSRRKGGRKGGAIAGGGLGLVVVLFLASQFLGVDLTPLAGVVSNQGSGQSEEVIALDNCETGADANEDAWCRMAAASDSLDRYWETQVGNYRAPGDVVLYSGLTDSLCGTASAATGPFYCPAGEGIYVDVAFFDVLRESYGASDGALAEMYVLAHEWGHHVSNIIGSLPDAGRETGAASGAVRLELQADCFAGAWVGSASTVTDDAGVPFLEPVTDAQIADALSAAAAVGDDHIMEQAGVRVNPDKFSHGTSAQRQKWFMVGYQSGPTACGTFDVAAADL